MADFGESSQKKLRKKLRLDVLDPVFDEFRSDKDICQMLKKSLEELCAIGAVCLKVLDTNARSPISFSNATCRVEEIWIKEKFPACTSFRTIFTFGYEILNEFLTSGRIPVKEDYREALRKLLQFLLHPHDNQPLFAGSAKYGSEKNWALVLIQHLLSNLSVSTEYFADSATMKEASCCPCDQRETISCRSVNTSIGCEKGWHGELDILIGRTPVKLAQDTEESSVEEIDNLSAEVNKDNFTKADLNQMLAQTITFSFLKRTGLIPLVGLSSSLVKMHFYDCEKDILLRCNTVNFILSEEKESFDIEVVLMLWLTLNYEIFCSGVPDELNNHKAEFHEEVGSFLECYKYTVSPFLFKPKADFEEKETKYRAFYDNYKKPYVEYV